MLAESCQDVRRVCDYTIIKDEFFSFIALLGESKPAVILLFEEDVSFLNILSFNSSSTNSNMFANSFLRTTHFCVNRALSRPTGFLPLLPGLFAAFAHLGELFVLDKFLPFVISVGREVLKCCILENLGNM